jgi:biopolymer transport protein ExbB
MQSQLGLMHLWAQGDGVTKGVALLLAAMSLASWIVILLKTLDVVRYKRQARRAGDFWHSEDLAAALDKLGSEGVNKFGASEQVAKTCPILQRKAQP